MQALARRRSCAPSIVPEATKYVDFGEVAERPCQPGAEDFGVHFLAPLHAPFTARGVTDRHRGLRSCVVLFDKVERRRRRTLLSVWPGFEICR